MPFSDITAITTAPQRTDDPDTFAALADPYVVSMRQFSIDMGVFKTELETAAALIDAAPAYADPGLVAMAGNTPAVDKFVYFTGASTSAIATVTAQGRTFLAAVDVAAQQTALGLGTMATQAASAVAITGGSIAGITDLAVADGGTGASTATAARSNLSAAKSGANSDITSLTGLSTALSVAQGGTGGTTAAAAFASLVTTGASLSADGYMQFANGVILQWGTGTSQTTTDTASDAQTITFPIEFPTAVWSVMVTTQLASAGNSDGMYQIYSVTTTQFRAMHASIEAAALNAIPHWFAIGN